MKLIKSIVVLLASGLFFVQCDQKEESSSSNSLKLLTEIPVLDVEFIPEKYVAYKTETPIEVDGDLTDGEWGKIEWTNKFDDLEGDKKPKPLYDTKVKMLWDDEYFYFGAELIEPHIWADIKDHDDIVLYNNDFEIFIDPDGDTHQYCEIEMNAFTTVWDLILTKPYRDKGKVIDSWHVYGLKKAVKIYGTINDPSDKDDRWTVEMAIPWKVMEELASHGGAPVNGEQWRVNFLRVNWQPEITNGTYSRKIDPSTNKPFNCFNWIWTVSGNSGCHAPELWSFVQFSDKKPGTDQFRDDPNDDLKWALRQVYYRQRAFMKENEEYAGSASQLKIEDLFVEGLAFAPEISIINGRWEAKQKAFNDKTAYIRWDGKVWLE
ncbi:MAG: hypothetical protein ACJA2S_001777 [Cyclobacteriaceae bacterium]|jgi:hypothetical protein